jgi:hypothetical protein
MAELITQRIRSNAAELRLHAIAEDPDELIERAETAGLGYREFLDLLLESEVGVLEGRRYQARLKMAGLPHHKTLDEFDAAFQPELDPKRLAELRSLHFIERRVGCLILGPPRRREIPHRRRARDGRAHPRLSRPLHHLIPRGTPSEALRSPQNAPLRARPHEIGAHRPSERRSGLACSPRLLTAQAAWVCGSARASSHEVQQLLGGDERGGLSRHTGQE